MTHRRTNLCMDCGGEHPHAMLKGLDVVCPWCYAYRTATLCGDPWEFPLFDPALPPTDATYRLYREVCERLGYTLRSASSHAEVQALNQAWSHELRVLAVREGRDIEQDTHVPYAGDEWVKVREQLQHEGAA